MWLPLGVLLLLVLLLPLLRGLWRATELFEISARAGSLKLERGRLPPSLFRELSDVAEHANLDGVEIRAVIEDGRPRLHVRGPGASGAEQSLRNVLGRFTTAQIRSGRTRAR